MTNAMSAPSAFVTVQGVVNRNSGHWLMEEQPQLVMSAVRAFPDAMP